MAKVLAPWLRLHEELTQRYLCFYFARNTESLLQFLRIELQHQQNESL